MKRRRTDGEGRGSLGAGLVDAGAVLDEEPDDRLVALPGGRLQRRAPLAVDGVDVGAVAQQQVHHGRVALPRRHVQRRPSLRVAVRLQLPFPRLQQQRQQQQQHQIKTRFLGSNIWPDWVSQHDL